MKNIDQLVKLLNEEFELRTTSEWVEILISAGVPCGPILNMHEVLNHEQIKDRETVIDLNHTKLGKIQNLSFPIKFSDNPQSLKLPPPLLGEHNDEILKDLGYSDKEISELKSESVITRSN
jgi:formyl-CoA transferase/CoA:oxalate CoA-transferase